MSPTLEADTCTHGTTRRDALLAALAGAWSLPVAAQDSTPARVPVLVYHRFADTVLDGMTVRTTTFATQLDVLRALDCRVIRLAELVDWRLGRRDALPPRALVLCADDGHRSQAEVFAPALQGRGWPATLFVYPSAVSNASYALRWDTLRALQRDGFDIESHTFWHAHLLRERRQRSPADFERFARDQLRRGRERLEQQLERRVALLAWPFGLADEGLCALARETGHEAAFGLGDRAAVRDDPVFLLPRLLVTEAAGTTALGHRLLRLFDGAA